MLSEREKLDLLDDRLNRAVCVELAAARAAGRQVTWREIQCITGPARARILKLAKGDLLHCYGTRAGKHNPVMATDATVSLLRAWVARARSECDRIERDLAEA